jgi:conjugative relaxase-like TrwC/TraI family protein
MRLRSACQSRSLYMEFSGDKFFERLPRETFKEIMAEIEAGVQARVRKDGADYDRTTGNLTYAWFIHREARPVDGISDCQWHIHCIEVNATFDERKKQWKAIQMGNIKTDAPFYQAAYTSLLTEKLMASSYAIRRTKNDFELANVSRELIDKFSRRHAKIKELEVALDAELEESAVTWSKKSGVSYEKTLGAVKAELGKKSREKKSTALLKDEELRANWRERMTPAERESLQIDRVKGPSEGFLEAEVAKELTLESLEEVSDKPRQERELHVAAALLRRGLGQDKRCRCENVGACFKPFSPKQATKLGLGSGQEGTSARRHATADRQRLRPNNPVQDPNGATRAALLAVDESKQSTDELWENEVSGGAGAVSKNNRKQLVSIGLPERLWF